MTIKEIAELCGVDDTTILRWTRNISDCKMQSDIKSKLKKSGHGIASDFSLEETLAIIGDGGGNKTLAALLEENSKNKNALSIAGSGGGAVQILNKFNDRLERIEKALGDLAEFKSAILKITSEPKVIEYRTINSQLDEDIYTFYKKHVDDSVPTAVYTKAIDVWDLFKYDTQAKYPKAEFLERFRAIYPQFVFEKNKNVDVFWGFRLVDTCGVC